MQFRSLMQEFKMAYRSSTFATVALVVAVHSSIVLVAGLEGVGPIEVSIESRYKPMLTPAASPMANITNHLGYMLFKHLQDGNKIVSPVSLMEVLFMLYFGASGRTRAELDKVMEFGKFGLKDEEKIEHEIAYQIRKWKDTKGQVMDLTRAYSSDEIYEPYLQRLRTMFDAEVYQSDFAKNSPAVTRQINEWISEKTSGNIPDFFKTDFDEYTKLVLISIITFKFQWKEPFVQGRSREGLFYNKGTEEAYATYMYKDSELQIGINEFAHSVTLRLPYDNTDYDMFIIGPYGTVGDREATIEDVESFLKQTKSFDTLLATEKKPDFSVAVEVPRFVVSSEVDVQAVLAKLGINLLFSPSANLDRISPANLHVSTVRQAGYAKIDEQGTEAGVVTAATASSRMIPSRLPDTVTFNKPFLFAIRNNKIHLNLFLGKISTVPES